MYLDKFKFPIVTMIKSNIAYITFDSKPRYEIGKINTFYTNSIFGMLSMLKGSFQIYRQL